MRPCRRACSVTGDSPVVDTQSTAINTTFDKDTLANLPSARDYWAILSEAPGVKLARIDVGGSAAGTQTTYFVYGTTGQNRPMVEGHQLDRRHRTRSATTSTTDRFRRCRSAAARRARRARCPASIHSARQQVGRQPLLAARSTATTRSSDWQSYNIDDEQIAAGVTGGGGLEPQDVNRLDSYRDINADIGGFLKKDTVWWYASVRSLDSAVRYTNFPVKPHETHLGNFTSKVTYQLSQNNKLIGYYQPSTKVQKNRLDRQLLELRTAAIHLTDDASFRQDYSPLLWKAEWNSRDQRASTLFELRTGQFGYGWPDTANGTGPSYEDLEHEHRVGEGAHAGSSTASARRCSARSATSRTSWAGNHNFKVGWEWFRETARRSGAPGRTTTCCTCFGAARRRK